MAASKVTGLHLCVNATLEISIARQDRNHRQILARHDVGDLGGQRAGVADAGRAPVTHQVETQRLEIRREARLVEVLGDDARTGRQ